MRLKYNYNQVQINHFHNDLNFNCSSGFVPGRRVKICSVDPKTRAFFLRNQTKWLLPATAIASGMKTIFASTDAHSCVCVPLGALCDCFRRDQSSSTFKNNKL